MQDNTNDVFTFDKKEHKYYLNDEHIPNVSTFLEMVDSYKGIPADILAKKGAIGTKVHKAIELLHTVGDYDEKKVKFGEREKYLMDIYMSNYYDPDEANKLLFVEKQLYDKKVFYAGTIDQIWEDKIIDLKTRKYKPVRDLLQMAAYWGVCKANGINVDKKELYILELTEKSHGLKKAYDTQAYNMFIKVVKFYKARNNISDTIKDWRKVWR